MSTSRNAMSKQTTKNILTGEKKNSDVFIKKNLGVDDQDTILEENILSNILWFTQTWIILISSI